PSEIALAKHYGVSRPVIREALRSAQALGLTRTRTGSGTFVIADTLTVPPSFDNYSTRDLMEARPAIEVPSAHYAALRHTPEQAEELLHICDLMDLEENPSEWVKLDSKFHVCVAAASGNQIFSNVVSDTRTALTQQSEMVNLVAHRRLPSNREHRAIAEAIVAGNSTAAAQLMQEHLHSVEVVLEPMIKKPE